MIDRAFIRIEEGLVHYRSREGANYKRSLFMAHAGPVSSLSLEPLMMAMPGQRPLFAPDTLGYGDSVSPDLDAPDITYFAESTIRVMDTLGLEKVDFYGSHTGANIGCEIAITHPERIGRLVLEGLGLFDLETRQDLLNNYAPQKEPDEYGAHLSWAWNFLRDQSMHYPYYKREPEYRLNVPVFPTELLHEFSLDVLKALRSYHKGYHAVFGHEIIERLPLINCPVLVLAHDYDPMAADVDAVIKLLANGQGGIIIGESPLADKAYRIDRFLSD